MLHLECSKRKLRWNCLIITIYNIQFLSPTSNHLLPLQVEIWDSNSRLVVDEDDNVKFRLERVKTGSLCSTNVIARQGISNISLSIDRVIPVMYCY